MLIILFVLCNSLSLNFIPNTKTPPNSRYNSFLDHLKPRSSLILFGGWLGSSGFNDIWEFSLLSMTWQEIIPLSSENPSIAYKEPRRSPAGLTSLSKPKFYIFGGQTTEGPENDFWEFDFDQMKWEKKNTFNTPSSRFSFGFASFVEGDHQVLVIQGGTTFYDLVNEMWRYQIFRFNLSSFEWTSMKNDGEVPLPSNLPVLFYYEGDLIQTAGYVAEDYCFPYLYRYSLTNEKWEVISSKKSDFACRFLCQGFIHDHKLFILYGWLTHIEEESQDVLIFDLKSKNQSWEKTQDFPSLASSEYSLVKVENTIFHFGGYHFSLGDYTNKFSKLDMKTLKVTEIHDNLIFPKQRTFHSMVLISEKIFLFGGIHKDQIFNDLWTFDLFSSRWDQVSTKGSIPSPRYLHATCAEGNSFVVWGGEDSSGLRNDFFIFNSLTETWTELVSSSAKPRPAKGTCLVMKDFKVFLYGGRTSSEVSNELWEYRFGSNSFHLVSHSTDHAVAYSQCWVEGYLLFVSLGTFVNEGPSGLIKVFNFSSLKWSDFHSHENKNADSSQSVQVFVGDQVVSVGGHLWGQETLKKISILGPGNQLKVFPMGFDLAVVGSASVYYGKKLFLFGGGIQIGNSFLPTVGHNLFFYINLEEICGNGNCQALCSAGTFNDGKNCRGCKAGSFNEKMGSLKCVECGPGTFNKNSSASSSQQCIPCHEGSYINEKGAETCRVCPKDKYCPVGSTGYLDVKMNEIKGSVQPPLYEDPDLSQSKIIYQTLVSVPLFLVFVILFPFKKLRVYAKKLDLFNEKHDNPGNDYMIRKKTLIGACFSFLVVIGALLLTCSTILEYFKANIQETKGLITLAVLESEASVFEADKLIVEISLFSYGGPCKSDFKNSLNVTTRNIEYANQLITCEKLKNSLCRIRISSNRAFINTGGFFTITLTENPCFSSGIEVNITSSSSIPDKISSVFSYIRPENNSVFIGSVPTEFYFLATPSLFKSESNRWDSKSTGYHISERNSPKSGSQYSAQDLSSVSYLNLKVFIEKGSTGLLTQRKLKQDFIFFVGSCLGTISGLFGIVGFIMAYFEAFTNKFFNKCISEDKVQKISAIDTDLNFTTVTKI